MYRKFNLLFFFRLFSFFLLFFIPGLYIPEIVPVFLFPLMSITVVLMGFIFEKTHLKLLPSAFLGSVFFAGLSFLLRNMLTRSHTAASDSLFLHFAVSLWIVWIVGLFSFLSTLLYLRSFRWKKYEPLVLIILACLLFWSQGSHSLNLFSHPIQATVFILAFLALQLFQLILQYHTSLKPLIPLLFFVPFLLLSVYFIVKTYNNLSVSNNGGLIQPTLFRFDFSPYLSLQNEIKLNDKLVLIVRTKQENADNLLRRVYLSGWNTRKGFFETVGPGEEPQIKEVPGNTTAIPHSDFLLRSPAEQEYFIVNFDPTSLIAMDYPVSITPYRIWNSSAFNGAYAVLSESTGYIPFELYDSPPPSGKPEEGLSKDLLDFYTKIDTENEALLGELSRSITSDIPLYYDKILALTAYLRDGDYRYSLKPGIAPDGNQLTWFLFDSKKGYCTYFAFSLCLMLRSLDIPSRVAAGFFIQPDSGALDYYPVRSNMAHAWVEVFFPRYGWIAFDPTTSQTAEGEDLLFNANPGGEEFMQLLSEIIDKRNLLSPDFKPESDTSSASPGTLFLRDLMAGIQRSWFYLVPSLTALCLLFIKMREILIIKCSKNSRRVILLLSGKMYALLNKNGKKKEKKQSRTDFITSVQDEDVSALFTLEQKARYAPQCDARDKKEALIIFTKIAKRFRKMLYFFSLFIVLSTVIWPPALSAQTPEFLLSDAQEAIAMENWESAITILTEGIRLYPANPEFHFTLGDLYFNKNLYTPAYTEFLSAKNLGKSNPEIFSRLSDSASFLNLDEESLGYLKKYLETSPDDLFYWSNFGWLCYKTHRLEEGISALLQITDTYGPDSNIFVGLGNLYTAAFNYTEAKKYYTLAISLAEERKQPYLASIYYYNRSILEEVFYNFEAAFEDTTKSLDASARSSGYLMQGELELRRLNYAGAFSYYLKAFDLDSTPLATLGLSDTLLQAGYSEEAERYLNSVRKYSDLSWIANYGTTIDQYKADLHKIQKELFKFKINKEKRKVIHSLSTFVLRSWNISKFTLLHWYHDSLFRIQTKKVAQSYNTNIENLKEISGHGLYINSFYFLAFGKWHKTAAPYLDRAENIESSFIAAAKPSYLYEKAVLTKDLSLFDTAISNLDPVWEKQYQAKALGDRIQHTRKGENTLKQQYIEKLYSLNPSSFIEFNLELPVSFDFQDTRTLQNKKVPSKIRHMLFDAGFRFEPSSLYSIRIKVSDKMLVVALINGHNNHTIYTQDIPSINGYPQDLPEFINRFSTGVYRTELGI